MRNKTTKIKNITFAIEAAPSATPPKPNIAAITAIIMKIIVQRSIVNVLGLIKTKQGSFIPMVQNYQM